MNQLLSIRLKFGRISMQGVIMAKGGPSISSGPIIASLRGATPLGIKVGGIEGGRSISISPLEARITNLFGPAIKSPHQIGFGIPSPRGERSVKALFKLKPFSAFPETKPESKIANIEPVKVQTVAKPEPRLFRVAVNPYAFASRLREARVQTQKAIRVETSRAVLTQIKPQVGTASETGARSAVSTAPIPKTETKQTPNRVRTNVGNSEPRNRILREEERILIYIGQDINANSRRLEALKRGYAGLIVESGVVDGSALAKISLIGTARSLRSKLLEQRGLNREDGSQRRIESSLEAIKEVNPRDLEKLVEDYTAVEATDKPPLKLATDKEVINVLVPPNNPAFYSEPLISKQVIEKFMEKEITERIEALKVQPEQVLQKLVDNMIFPTNPLDSLLNNDYMNNRGIRRKLILAA